MKFLRTFFSVLFIGLVFITTSCSKDKSEDISGGINTGIGRPGDPHSYQIQIIEGDHTGFEISGQVANEDGQALYFVDDGKKGIVWGIYNNEMVMNGIFLEAGNNYTIPENEEETWVLQLTGLNKSFIAKNVTLSVPTINYEGFQSSGFAAFQMNFDGIFYQNIDENDLYRIKGSIVVNFMPF